MSDERKPSTVDAVFASEGAVGAAKGGRDVARGGQNRAEDGRDAAKDDRDAKDDRRSEERKIALYKNFKTVNFIDPSYYEQFNVKRGLRNADGTGVVAGMTNVANVHGYVMSDGE